MEYKYETEKLVEWYTSANEIAKTYSDKKQHFKVLFITNDNHLNVLKKKTQR